ncbi:MAG: 2-hydroxychromene-2-carboxylate isomerase [Rhodocyclales bacterium]|nr:2-hydroxychromene-2-carboxylate isomerase [Rhodocyclales bacterium]
MAITTILDTPASEPALPGERVVDFYFDFISPFGFFASLRIDGLAARYGYRTRWNPMLIGVSVLKVMGMKPLLETPLKGAYILRDGNRYARREKITLGRRIDAPMADPRPAGRAYSWIRQHLPDREREFARHLFAAYWLQGQDISNAATLDETLTTIGLDLPEVKTGIRSDEAASLLRHNVEASLERGVFGSPYFIVDGEPFFGVEKMELLEEWLKSGGW